MPPIEQAVTFRALWFARGFTAPLPGYDQDVAAAGGDDNRITGQCALERFRRVQVVDPLVVS